MIRMSAVMHIDFVSDVACPWCAIGLASLEEALRRTRDVATAQIRFQPYELNGDMRAGGENVDDYLGVRLGVSASELAAMRERLRTLAANVGLEFNQHGGSRIYSTFDAHRLLQFASENPATQLALKRALFKANFTDNLDISAHDVLLAVAHTAGIDPVTAGQLLASDQLGREVREAEQFWHGQGITAVPAMIINRRWLISGGQPPEAIEQALRQIAADASFTPSAG